MKTLCFLSTTGAASAELPEKKDAMSTFRVDRKMLLQRLLKTPGIKLFKKLLPN